MQVPIPHGWNSMHVAFKDLGGVDTVVNETPFSQTG